jgi:hypothetical protein
MEKIIVGQHTFEIVDFIPYGYHIWNIGKNMKEGYLPLVLLGGYDDCQVIGTKKAIYLKDAQKVLSVMGYGTNTVKKLESYIDKHNDSEGEKDLIKKMKEALLIMYEIKGINNLDEILKNN